MRNINWAAILAGSVMYIILIVIVGGLIVNTGGETVGPITDIILTLLLVLIVAYVSARKTKL
jgi:hypothetical protein